MTNDERARPGRRVVTIMYFAILALTALFGYVIGTISPNQLDPMLFGFVQLPQTPLGVAIYGAVTVGLGLGLLLVLVDYVSKRTGAADR